MKYLMIHKLLWIVIVLLSVIFELLYCAVGYILYVLWNFKFPKDNLWETSHTYYDTDKSPLSEDCVTTDKNPWETIKRRYHIFFN